MSENAMVEYIAKALAPDYYIWEKLEAGSRDYFIGLAEKAIEAIKSWEDHVD